MSSPSRPPTYAQYGVKPLCNGCGRRLTADESLWFRGHPNKEVYGDCCFSVAAAAYPSA